MKWCVKYYHIGARVAGGYAVLANHNANDKVWYDNVNMAHAHREAHQKLCPNTFVFKVEEYYD